MFRATKFKLVVSIDVEWTQGQSFTLDIPLYDQQQVRRDFDSRMQARPQLIDDAEDEVNMHMAEDMLRSKDAFTSFLKTFEAIDYS